MLIDYLYVPIPAAVTELEDKIVSLTSQLNESNDKLSLSSSQFNEAKNKSWEVEKNYKLLSGDHNACVTFH